MKRVWTAQTINDWVARRDAYREQRKKPSMAALRESADVKDRQAYERELAIERKVLKERLDELSTAFAWVIDKPPLERYPAPFSGTLHLPTNLHQSTGHATKLKFSLGDDLNMLIFEFYDAKVPSDYKGTNFVSVEALSPRRHEYLGPAPKVVGFQFFEATGEAHIEWWDAYLKEKWVDAGFWRNEVYFDEDVHGWVSKPRGDYSRYPDLDEYLVRD
ncbi:hypothetical protein HETIRDRAFT_169954 [Heterobasidion irregulare TC 32-1]|uniref:Uncharacterized protein n=1 Tax=Heterobasidion irregulare (strain TC 32-1) TaxID=747525 RepID=W4K5W7_HETIT|nr:uncharacterized protein HETIRDRAFT_169954 [Heterobasidion irregulare TC 32-1]ETW81197.1 hypothetical protein HETIRDRAFT_169954 [Heterobasidion irregulare TC 32-1]